MMTTKMINNPPSSTIADETCRYWRLTGYRRHEIHETETEPLMTFHHFSYDEEEPPRSQQPPPKKQRAIRVSIPGDAISHPFCPNSNPETLTPSNAFLHH